MRMKVREIGPGLHPSEIVVEIRTANGSERLVVDRGSIPDRTLFVGWRPLGQKNGQWLVELPNEAMSGTWRVWIKRSEVLPEKQDALGVA
jgi:hypothetical protein